jgi:CRISPR-associated protein Csm3
MNPVFKANIIIRGKIELLTGMHVGGSKDKMEIGGVDSPVIRNPQNRYPYIPGSSLKGKMRSLLEYALGVVDENGDVSKNEKIVRIFGIGANEEPSGPTRLIVRDATPDEKTIETWKKIDSELLYTEYKPENTIDRLTSAANPRFIERVVAGSLFNFEMVFGIYQMNEKDTTDRINEDLSNLKTALNLLEHSAIGGSGSRGSGKVKFHIAKPVIVKTEDYKTGSIKYKESLENLSSELNSYQSLQDITLSYSE